MVLVFTVFALNRPVVALFGSCNKVYTFVGVGKVQLFTNRLWDFPMMPDDFKLCGVGGVKSQVVENKGFKRVSFVFFAKPRLERYEFCPVVNFCEKISNHNIFDIQNPSGQSRAPCRTLRTRIASFFIR
jgi:hypothetical protein